MVARHVQIGPPTRHSTYCFFQETLGRPFWDSMRYSYLIANGHRRPVRKVPSAIYIVIKRIT
jgi:hypothetical protein